jgi:hypothetical protein
MYRNHDRTEAKVPNYRQQQWRFFRRLGNCVDVVIVFGVRVSGFVESW